MSAYALPKTPEYLRDARLKAGYVSRCTASPDVPFSPETIGRHERGETRLSPEDMVVYADCYSKPDLLMRYCEDCPIGSGLRQSLVDRDFTLAALRLGNRLTKAAKIAQKLSELADDGNLDALEYGEFLDMIHDCDTITTAFEELKLWALSNGVLTPGEIKRSSLKQQGR